MSAGSQRVRRHNRERGPCRPTASPSAGPGVRRFWLPAIDSRIRGKSLSQEALFSRGNSKRGHQPNVSIFYYFSPYMHATLGRGAPPSREATAFNSIQIL